LLQRGRGDPSCASDSLSQNKSDQLCCGRNQPGIVAATAMNDYPKRVWDSIIPLSVGDTLLKALRNGLSLRSSAIMSIPLRRASYVIKSLSDTSSRSGMPLRQAFSGSARDAYLDSAYRYLKRVSASPHPKPRKSSLASMGSPGARTRHVIQRSIQR
jgi:hypothetical protein